MPKYFDYIAKPKSAWLTVNRACNFRCKWCYGQSTQFDIKDTMDVGLAKKLVDCVAEAGVKRINFIGGEPTLWKDLFEIITYCKENKITTGLITNGSRFSDPVFCDKYNNNPCDYIGVSVKSANENDFLKATGVQMFRETTQGLKRIFAKYNAGFETVYNNVIGRKGLIEIAKYCHDLGAKNMTLSLCSSIIDGDGEINNRYLNIKNIAQDIQEIYSDICDIYNGNIQIEMFLPLCFFSDEFVNSLFEKNQIVSICHVHDRDGVIFDTNGDILPCNTMVGNHILRYPDDYNDGNSLIRSLNSKKLIDDYHYLLRYPSKVCTNCKWNQKCKGGCILNWVTLDPALCEARV